jgi:hypothetical protein
LSVAIPRAALLVCFALGACASTRAFEPAPEPALGEVLVFFERAPEAPRVTLHNGSRWNAQYLFPLFACSRTAEAHEDSNPRDAARFATGNPERDIWERSLGAGARVAAELSRPPCSDPRDRVGVYFKFERAGRVSYRVVWSAPIGSAPAGP